MNPGTFNSGGEDYSVAEDLDANETKDLERPSTSSPEDC